MLTSLFDQKAREGRFDPGIHEAVTVVMYNRNSVTDFQLQKTTSGDVSIAAANTLLPFWWTSTASAPSERFRY